MAKNVLTHNLSLPLNGTKTATVDINSDSGNLTIDQLTSRRSSLRCDVE
jgi:ACT domain-containing protein